MTCSRPDLRERLELYVLKQLPPDQMREMQHHLLECDECSDNFNQQVPLAGALEHEERQKQRMEDHGGHGAPDDHGHGGHGAPAPEFVLPLPAGWQKAAILAFVAFAIAIAAVIIDSRSLPDPKAGEANGEHEKGAGHEKHGH